MEFTYQPGQTPLDPDEKEGLKPKHISTQGELNEWEQLNIIKGARWASASSSRMFWMMCSCASCTSRCSAIHGHGLERTARATRISVAIGARFLCASGTCWRTPSIRSNTMPCTRMSWQHDFTTSLCSSTRFRTVMGDAAV